MIHCRLILATQAQVTDNGHWSWYPGVESQVWSSRVSSDHSETHFLISGRFIYSGIVWTNHLQLENNNTPDLFIWTLLLWILTWTCCCDSLLPFNIAFQSVSPLNPSPYWEWLSGLLDERVAEMGTSFTDKQHVDTKPWHSTCQQTASLADALHN